MQARVPPHGTTRLWHSAEQYMTFPLSVWSSRLCQRARARCRVRHPVHYDHRCAAPKFRKFHAAARLQGARRGAHRRVRATALVLQPSSLLERVDLLHTHVRHVVVRTGEMTVAKQVVEDRCQLAPMEVQTRWRHVANLQGVHRTVFEPRGALSHELPSCHAPQVSELRGSCAAA